MKKFLTVLLALSVVFTYTVGSAFAVTITAPDAKDQLSSSAAVQAVNDAYTAVKADLLKAKTDALYSIFGNSTSKTLKDVTVSKTAVESVYNDMAYDKALAQAQKEYEVMLNEVQKGIAAKADYFYVVDKTNTTVGEGTEGTNVTFGINTTFTKTTDGTNGIDYAVIFALNKAEDDFETSTTGAAKVAQAEAKALKASTLAAVRATDLTAYSKEYKGAAKSEYDKAVEAQNAAITELNGIVISDSATWAEVYTSGILAAIKAVYVAPVNNQDASGSFAKALELLTKTADEPTEAVKLEWAKAKVLALLTNDINVYYNDLIEAANKDILDETIKGAKGDAAKIARAKENITVYKEQAAAAIDVVTYLVNNTKGLKNFITEAKPFSTSTILVGNGKAWNFAAGTLTAPTTGASYTAVNMVAIVDHVADLKQDAANKQASVLIDGAEYVAIQDALDTAIETTYMENAPTTALGVGDAQVALWARQDALNSAGDVTIGSRKYQGVGTWTIVGYEEDKYDAVRAVVAETTDAIEAAKTIEAADAAYLAGYEKLQAIPTSSTKAAAQATKEFADLKAQYDKEISAYVAYKAQSIDAAGNTDKYSFNDTTLIGKLQAELAKAYTVDELKVKFTEAKAFVDALKTKAELEEAKKALDARVAALPATITVADKETVATLNKDLVAHNEYCDQIGNVSQKVIITAAATNALTKVQTLEADAIRDAIKSIGTVTIEDKAAIEAVQKQLDAYVASYAGENATTAQLATLKAVSYNTTTVADLQTALDKAEVNNFKVLVGKLSADGSDVAGVAAARAAYEAMSRAAKKDAYRTTEFDKLLDLEKLVVKNVETLKITASSKAYKGKILVKWTVKGTTTGVKYQVYKSTKKNSGFKKAFTTSKKSYKNTKGLKKGTRYYYKVRAYKVVDGKTYYSDWSNKAIRVAK